MNPEKEKKLVDAFPLLYRDVHENAPLTRSLMQFGFNFDDGWFQLTWDMSAKLEAIIAKYIKKNPEAHVPRAIQMKEKYGTLRAYVSGVVPGMDKVINKAEKTSAKTCELCGEKGFLCHAGHWYKTLCENCAFKHDYKKYIEKDDLM